MWQLCLPARRAGTVFVRGRGEATRLGCARFVLLIPGSEAKGPPRGHHTPPPGMPAPSSLGSVPATVGSVLVEGVCEMAKFSRRKGSRENWVDRILRRERKEEQLERLSLCIHVPL